MNESNSINQPQKSDRLLGRKIFFSAAAGLAVLILVQVELSLTHPGWTTRLFLVLPALILIFMGVEIWRNARTKKIEVDFATDLLQSTGFVLILSTMAIAHLTNH